MSTPAHANQAMETLRKIAEDNDVSDVLKYENVDALVEAGLIAIRTRADAKSTSTYTRVASLTIAGRLLLTMNQRLAILERMVRG